MKTELRPLTLGEILDRTAQLYRAHFLLFVGIAVFPRALLLIWQLLDLGITRYLESHHHPTTVFTISGTVFGLVLYFAFAGIGVAAINRAVSALYLGETATIVGSYNQVKPHWARYIGVMVLAALYAWGPAALPYAALFGIGIASKNGWTAGNGHAVAIMAVGGVAGLAMLFTIPFGIWMSLRYALAVPASIFENIAIRASLKRSVALTLKGRGRIFVMALLVGIVFWTIAAAAEAPFLVLIYRAAKNHQQPPLLSVIASQFINFFLYSVIGPVYGIATTLFYYDERIRKEGFDIDFMMQQANLTVPAPPPPPPPPAFDSMPDPLPDLHPDPIPAIDEATGQP